MQENPTRTRASSKLTSVTRSMMKVLGVFYVLTIISGVMFANTHNTTIGVAFVGMFTASIATLFIAMAFGASEQLDHT